MSLNRAVIIITDGFFIESTTYDVLGAPCTNEVETSGQLLADLRALAALPDLLAAEFAPGLTSVTLTTEVETLLAAQEAADRVRAAIGDTA